MSPDPLTLLDPDLRSSAMQIQPMMEQFLPMTVEKLESWRALTESNSPPPLTDLAVDEREIRNAAGGTNVTVYVINAMPDQARPGILHVHGGGFYAGSARASLRQMQQMAKALDCTIVTVEYRLAPEVCYSGSVEDTYTALCWMHENAEAIGVELAPA